MHRHLFWIAAPLVVIFSAATARGDTVEQPGLFSYQAPAGWTVQLTQFSKYKIAYETPHDGFSANINVVLEHFAGSLFDYVAANKKMLSSSKLFANLSIIDEKPFITAGQVTAARVAVRDTRGSANLQQIFYFFSGKGDVKLVVTASCLAKDGEAYARQFDQSIVTFQPE